MRTQNATSSETLRQYLRNAIAQIEAGVETSERDLREVVKELDFLTSHGTPEQAASAKLDVARQAVKVEQLLPRLRTLADEIEFATGEEALRMAEAPVVFQ
jgi:ribosomal protein S20